MIKTESLFISTNKFILNGIKKEKDISKIFLNKPKKYFGYLIYSGVNDIIGFYAYIKELKSDKFIYYSFLTDNTCIGDIFTESNIENFKLDNYIDFSKLLFYSYKDNYSEGREFLAAGGFNDFSIENYISVTYASLYTKNLSLSRSIALFITSSLKPKKKISEEEINNLIKDSLKYLIGFNSVATKLFNYFYKKKNISDLSKPLLFFMLLNKSKFSFFEYDIDFRKFTDSLFKSFQEYVNERKNNLTEEQKIRLSMEANRMGFGDELTDSYFLYLYNSWWNN